MKFDKLTEAYMGVVGSKDDLNREDYDQKIKIWDELSSKISDSKTKMAVNDMFYVYKHSIQHKDKAAYKSIKDKVDIIFDFLAKVYS